MAKYKLALIGKNIAHSKSPEVYKTLLDNNVEYTLLDFLSEKEIPKLSEMLKTFDGISITTPYKEHFIKDVMLDPEAKQLNAINCISQKKDQFIGHNTDFLAIVDILKKYFEENKIDRVIILGDGVMSRVCSHVLNNLKINFEVLSRKQTPNFSNLNLVEYLDRESLLVINTCSRDYVYSGDVNFKILFWDLNYSFKPHQDHLLTKCHYKDGLEMLYLQAEYALGFWSIKKKI